MANRTGSRAAASVGSAEGGVGGGSDADHPAAGGDAPLPLPPQQQQPSADAASSLEAPPPKPRQQAKFCRSCGGGVDLVLAEGGTRWRHHCQACGEIEYYNPRMVVGAVVEHEGRILLCRRGIEPQRGLWTLPAGFMELDESTAEGAARETWEEAAAPIEIVAPFVHFDIPVIGQTYILFRARLAPPFTFAAQLPETLETRLFAPDELPWDEIAFSSVQLALQFLLDDMEAGTQTLHHGVIRKRPGQGPNAKFELTDHFPLALAGPPRPPQGGG
eukprot:scaffold1.g5470.t1